MRNNYKRVESNNYFQLIMRLMRSQLGCGYAERFEVCDGAIDAGPR